MTITNIEFDQLTQQEASFRKNYPLAWLASLIGPIAVTAVVLLTIGTLNEWATVGRVIFAALATFFIFGRFVILFGNDFSTPIPTADAEAVELVHFLSSGELAFMVTYMDVMTVLFVAFHMGVLFRLPWLGPKLAEVVNDARIILQIQPWMRQATLLGLVVFVIFPTSTTGSVGGSILGRLLGLTRLQTLFAIFTGSVIGNGLMFMFSDRLRPLKELLQDSLTAKVIGISAVVILLITIERWFKSVKKKYAVEV